MEQIVEDITDEDTERIFFPFISDSDSEPAVEARPAADEPNDHVGDAVLLEECAPQEKPRPRRRPSRRRRRVARRSLTGLGLRD